ncbi:MAG: hypothetical protein HY040_09210 [Planctomycetes bacterium]|nr:hypothetical protein [Planctomycetota bacterium]
MDSPLRLREWWILAIALGLPALAAAQEANSQSNVGLAPGKWKRVGGGDEITISVKDNSAALLTLSGFHKDWGDGVYDQSIRKWRFIRYPRPSEMGDSDPVTGKKVPDWAKRKVTTKANGGALESGGIEWQLVCDIHIESGELVLAGQWYRGEVWWREDTDDRTQEIRQDAKWYTDAQPVHVQYKKICMTESDSEVIELAAAEAALLKSQTIPESVIKTKPASDIAYWFAQLYYYITRYEIEKRGNLEHPGFLLHFIPVFYDMYAENAERFANNQPDSIAPQWKDHFFQSRIGIALEPTMIGPYLERVRISLTSGVQAHIKTDMSEALANAYLSYRQKYCDAPPFEAYHDDFFKRNRPVFDLVKDSLINDLVNRVIFGGQGASDPHVVARVSDIVKKGLNNDDVYDWRETAWQDAAFKIKKAQPKRPER